MGSHYLKRLVTLLALLPFGADALTYPVTPRIPCTEIYHGIEVIDPYQWLENEHAPSVKKWVEQQNALTEEYFKDSPYQKGIFHRLKELTIKSNTGTYATGHPERLITHYQSVENEQPIYYLQEGENSPPIEILNPNSWGKGYRVELFEPSPNGKFAAFGMSKGGNESPTIYLINLDTLEVQNEPLCGWGQSHFAWHPNGQGFYYSARPEKGSVAAGDEYYWETVFYHKLGTPCSEDKKIFFDEEIKDWIINGVWIEDNQLLFYRYRWSDDGNRQAEILARDLDDPESPAHKVSVITEDDLYEEKVIGDRTYIITNDGAPNGKILLADGDTLHPWLLESAGIIKDISGIGGNLAVTYLWDAHTVVLIFDIEGNFLREVPLPGLGVASFFSRWENPTGYFLFSSPTQPLTGYLYNVDDNETSFEIDEYDGKFNFSNYVTKEIWYQSKDGTPVSMFLAHRRDLIPDGTQPTLLTGYGGFSYCFLPSFKPRFAPWLEAGGVVVLPNLRGGGEYGKEWHQQGTRENKQNVFDDFIAAAEWLIENNYTSEENLVIEGASNGGLLVGAAMTQRPDLFKAVVCGVPLLDMLRYHRFKIGAVWTGEYGCADNEEHFDFLKQYSPYHNVTPDTAYPATLFYSGQNDFRVDPFHVRKMVAKLQNFTASEDPILMHLDAYCGHQAPSKHARCRILATNYSFLMQQLNMPSLTEPPPQPRSSYSLKRKVEILEEQSHYENLQDHAEKKKTFLEFLHRHQSRTFGVQDNELS